MMKRLRKITEIVTQIIDLHKNYEKISSQTHLSEFDNIVWDIV